MYQRPKLLRFGTLRELTLVGCMGPTDGDTFMGATSVGGDNTPILENGTTLWCFVQRS